MSFLALIFKFLGRISPRLTAAIAWPLFCIPYPKRNSSLVNRYKLEGQAQHLYIDYKTYKVAIYKWTPTQYSSECLTFLFTHGWAGNSFDFIYIISEILKQGHIIIAFDAPAHGRSTGRLTTLRTNAETLVDVARKFGPIDILIGHSFGTMACAFALSLAQHNNSLSRVKKLVLISSPNKLVDIVQWFTQSMNLPNLVVKIFHKKIEGILKRPIDTMNIPELLKEYTGKTLVIHDRKDHIISYKEAEKIASLTNAELFSTNGFGHRRILGIPEVTEKVLKFVKSNN